MDDLDGAIFDAPTCPDCGTVLRVEADAFVCRCGYREPFSEIEMPAEFDGPTLNGG